MIKTKDEIGYSNGRIGIIKGTIEPLPENKRGGSLSKVIHG